MSRDPYNQLSTFSRRYSLCHDVDVEKWSDEHAGMAPDLYNMLAEMFGVPLIGYTGGHHYCFRPMNGIPAQTAAVPADNHATDPYTLLIRND